MKFIPATHPKTKQRVRVGLEQYFVFPPKLRFDERAVARFRAIERLMFMIFILFSDPILAGVFQTSGFVIQACLIPVFFAIRATFEYVFEHCILHTTQENSPFPSRTKKNPRYAADYLTSRHFGSDAMPVVNFQGVLNHEVCLSMMLCNINHPIIFGLLVCGDVLENIICLYSLHRTISSTNKVSPEQKEEEEVSYEGKKQALEKRTWSLILSLTLILVTPSHQLALRARTQVHQV